MLIRSQDKHLLIDMSNRIIGVNNEFVYIADEVKPPRENVLIIGAYRTEERALEVLEFIQYVYEDSLYTGCDGIVATNRVAEMPEE